MVLNPTKSLKKGLSIAVNMHTYYNTGHLAHWFHTSSQQSNHINPILWRSFTSPEPCNLIPLTPTLTTYCSIIWFYYQLHPPRGNFNDHYNSSRCLGSGKNQSAESHVVKAQSTHKLHPRSRLNPGPCKC